MSLSSAFNIISSSFIANAAQTAVVSKNIANANSTGYSRETANVLTNSYGGADVNSVSRATDGALLDQVNASTSQAAAAQALSTGLTTLAETVSDSATASTATGSTQNGSSPSAMLSNLQSALETYQASPSNSSAGTAVVTAAKNLATSLNSATTTVQQVRSQADTQIATAVGTVNSLLNQFTAVNNTIVSGLAAGTDVSTAEDSRDTILTQLSQQVGISTVVSANGSTSIYTDSGVTLFQDTPRTVAFTPTPTLTAGASGNAVTVDGVPITGASAPMAVQSGAIAGLADLRDNVAPEYQAQLDQIAGGLINAFAETDQSTTNKGLPSLPGLFTTAGATALPATDAMTGLAGQIIVNKTVDPSQGGNVNLLRDGGVSDPGNAAYTYNTTGAASYSGRISELVSQITASRGFGSGTGLSTSSDLADYANSSVSWLQGQNQAASDAADYQNSLATTATSALSSSTGVNMDTEMTNMLNLENSYTTTAKLLTTVTAMFSALLDAA